MRESIQVTVAVVAVLAVGLACKPRKRIVEDPPPVNTSSTTSSDPDPDDDDDDTDPKAASTSTSTATATATGHAVKPAQTATATATHTAATPAPTHKDPPCFGGDHPRVCNGVCVHLATDDNNCGACGYKCQAGKHCDGHLFCRDAEGNL